MSCCRRVHHSTLSLDEVQSELEVHSVSIEKIHTLLNDSLVKRIDIRSLDELAAIFLEDGETVSNAEKTSVRTMRIRKKGCVRT
jgi:hypothetical protein